MSEVNLCACGCGQPVRAGREFRQGHDATLRSALLRRVREQADWDAAEELIRRRWPFPLDALQALRKNTGR